MTDQTKQRYTLTVETRAGIDAEGRTPEQRLRQALKRLGRQYRLRCVRVAPADPERRDGDDER